MAHLARPDKVTFMSDPTLITNEFNDPGGPYAVQSIKYEISFKQMEYNKTHGDVVISTLQVQVDDVKNVMTQNIEKVLNRDERLSELADRSGDLETAAHGFQKNTTKISRKMWWKNTKLIIIIAVVILIVVVFIILLATGVIPT